MYQYRLNFTAAQRNAGAGAWLTGRLFPWRRAPNICRRIFPRMFAPNIRPNIRLEYSRIYLANIRREYSPKVRGLSYEN